MNQVTVAIFVALALPGCASAPQPEQAVDTDRAPCTGERFDGDHRNLRTLHQARGDPRAAMQQIELGMRERRRLSAGEMSAQMGSAG